MLTRLFTTVIFVAGISNSAYAATNSLKRCGTPQPEIEIPKFALGTPTTSGSGCPKDTVGVSMTDDKKTVSFIFDTFISEVGNSVELKRDIKKCTVTIPIDVPKGWQVVTIKLDQRGFYSIPKKGTLDLEQKYTVYNKRNQLLSLPITKKTAVRGPADAEYTKSQKVVVPAVVSPCGEAIKFKYETKIDLKTNSLGDDALATVDSLDASGDSKGYLVKFFMQKCKK